MLTTIAIAKAVAFPILLAVGLVALIRRSASGWCLLAAFLCGMLGAFSVNQSILRSLPPLLAENQVEVATAGQAWLSGFVEAAFPEELSKGLWMLVFLIGWRRYSAGHGAIIGALVGLGFALRENLSYAQLAPEWRLMAVFSHGGWGVIMGSLIQDARMDSIWRIRKIILAFIAPILLHGLLDTSIFLVEAYESQARLSPTGQETSESLSPAMFFAMLSTIAVLIVSLVWAIRLIRSVRQQLGDGRVSDLPEE